LELGIGAGVKSWNDGATGPTKKFDDIFSRPDTINQHDGRTPGNSKDRAYVQRCAVKNGRCNVTGCLLSFSKLNIKLRTEQ